MLHVLDLVGVFAFAAYGAHTASRYQLDYFGIVVCGLITALGGGTIREIIVHAQPIYFHDYTYIYVALAGAGFALILQAYFAKIHKYMLVLDAIGLVTFAFIGAARANAAGLGLVPVLFFAVLTAAGGGVITDVICNRKPGLFCGDFYATPALLLALTYYLLRHAMHHPLTVGFLLAVIFLLRIGVLFVRHSKMQLSRFLVQQANAAVE